MTRTTYECLEAGCDLRMEAENEEELVELVQRHMSEAHNSFELEDVILANATLVKAPANEEA
jgi:predicted small metal-binding protein